jgi:hypothetical protein
MSATDGALQHLRLPGAGQPLDGNRMPTVPHQKLIELSPVSFHLKSDPKGEIQ